MRTTLQIPANGLAEITTDVRNYGARNVETGALLLTAPGQDTVTVVALAGARGVTRRRGLFVLTKPVINNLFDYAEERGLQARAQVHSHQHRAFLSDTDRQGNIRLPGFIAAVIPNFDSPPTDPVAWGWWTFADQDWHPSPAGVITHATAHIITVDSECIHEH